MITQSFEVFANFALFSHRLSLTLEHEICTSLMSCDTYLYDTLIVRIFSSEIRQKKANFQESPESMILKIAIIQSVISNKNK